MMGDFMSFLSHGVLRNLGKYCVKIFLDDINIQINRWSEAAHPVSCE